MSITLYITPQTPLPGVRLNDDRVSLARELDDLTPLAEQLGVQPLTAFESYSNDDLPEPMDEELPVSYFPPADALRTISALLTLTTLNPAVTQDLLNCQKALTALNTTPFRFHRGD